MNQNQKIIFDYYIHDARLDHVLIRPFFKKIIKIPFYLSIKSNNGFYLATSDNIDERRNFFSMMTSTLIMEDGIDCFTGHKQFIPFFAYFEKLRPQSNIACIGIFSTLHFFTRGKNIHFMEQFMGFSLDQYNYLQRDIFYDYLFDDNVEFKEYSLIAIRKYCYLHFIMNFLISANLTDNMDYLYYVSKYMIMFRLINLEQMQFFFAKKILLNSRSFFENESDIFKMISYKYAPRYVDFRYPDKFTDVYNIISPESIKRRIYELNSQSILF